MPIPNYRSGPMYYIVDDHGNVHDKSVHKASAEAEAKRLSDDPTVTGTWHVLTRADRMNTKLKEN